MKKQTKKTEVSAPGVDVPRETAEKKIDLSTVDVAQIRKWLKADVGRCISLFYAIVENDSLLDEISEVMYSRMRVAQAKRDKEGQI